MILEAPCAKLTLDDSCANMRSGILQMYLQFTLPGPWRPKAFGKNLDGRRACRMDGSLNIAASDVPLVVFNLNQGGVGSQQVTMYFACIASCMRVIVFFHFM